MASQPLQSLGHGGQDGMRDRLLTTALQTQFLLRIRQGSAAENLVYLKTEKDSLEGIKRLMESLGWLMQARLGLRFISQSPPQDQAPKHLPSCCDWDFPDTKPESQGDNSHACSRSICSGSVSPLNSISDYFHHVPLGSRNSITPRSLVHRIWEEQF